MLRYMPCWIVEHGHRISNSLSDLVVVADIAEFTVKGAFFHIISGSRSLNRGTGRIQLQRLRFASKKTSLGRHSDASGFHACGLSVECHQLSNCSIVLTAHGYRLRLMIARYAPCCRFIPIFNFPIFNGMMRSTDGNGTPIYPGHRCCG